MEFLDIAGLVQGASQGEGLGNQFLSHIREVDAIIQVVRCFDDADVHHVSGNVDPLRDIEVINTELVLADLASAQKRFERNAKKARSGDKEAKAEQAVLEKLLPHLDEGNLASLAQFSDEERGVMNQFFLLTAKPMLFACNVAESDLAAVTSGTGENGGLSGAAAGYVGKVREYAGARAGAEAVVISAQIESELVELGAEEAQEYLRDLGVEESGVGALIRATYQLLGLQTYLTTGPKESRAWTIRAGAKAPQAAGVIHSDFERGFIAAEVIACEKLLELGSFAKAREAGQLRIEGKDYVMREGDVVEFRFNV